MVGALRQARASSAAAATTYRQALFPGRSETAFEVQPEAVAPAGCAGADRRTAGVRQQRDAAARGARGRWRAR